MSRYPRHASRLRACDTRPESGFRSIAPDRIGNARRPACGRSSNQLARSEDPAQTARCGPYGCHLAPWPLYGHRNPMAANRATTCLRNHDRSTASPALCRRVGGEPAARPEQAAPISAHPPHANDARDTRTKCSWWGRIAASKRAKRCFWSSFRLAYLWGLTAQCSRAAIALNAKK
jgi:hypothetical protein